MKDEQLCKEILRLVGGQSNIAEAYHCITRLRLNVRDLSKVKVDELKKLHGVLTVQVLGKQVQIVIGPGVEQVYDTFCKVADIKQQVPIDASDDSQVKKESDENDIVAIATKNADTKSKNPITKLLNT